MSRAGDILENYDEEDDTCPHCGGSGGGSEPSCPYCHGSGQSKRSNDREYEPEDDLE